MTVVRASENPIIKPEDIKPSQDGFEVIGVFNTAATRRGDEVILLLRVAERPCNDDPSVVLTAAFDIDHNRIMTRAFSRSDPESDFSDPRLIVRPEGTYLTSISHLRIARSQDGIHFEIEESPAIGPSNGYESLGVEDPRITLIDEIYYITYVAVSPLGVTTALASTQDFKSFKRHGVIFAPENKDVVLFPEKISGKYFAIHRPHSPLFTRNDMWIAESPDLHCWGHHRQLLGLREGMWDDTRIGAGAPPFRIDEGWLEIYHGADHDNHYCLGAVLLDVDQPWKVLARSDCPVFEPEAPYERNGFFGQVVFSCGLLFEDQTLKVYYGAADTVTCYAELPLADVLAALKT